MKNIKKIAFAILTAIVALISTSCVRIVDADTGEVLGGNVPYEGRGQGGQMGPSGRRQLDDFTVKRIHFQASIDSNHASRQQEVSEYASDYFEKNNGAIITDDQISRHFGFECHVRQVGRIQTRKARPDEVPPAIRAKFSN